MSIIPSLPRKGAWMQTYLNIQFWPCDPRPDEVSIIDIAHSLSNQCRYAGHCSRFYSVAEHSVLVFKIARDVLGVTELPMLLAAFLHDSTEAYLVDLPRPVKHSLPGYKVLEEQLARCIEYKYGLPMGAFEDPVVKRADNIALMTEASLLLGPPPAPWEETEKPLPGCGLGCWAPEVAEREFLRQFNDIYCGMPNQHDRSSN